VTLFLGVDGGQTSTTALIGDESGRVLGLGRAGPCNHARAAEGRAKFVRALEGSVRDALDHAGIAAPIRDVHFEAACMGLSGGPEDKDALAREIVTATHYLITHDAAIALTGATGGVGVVIIAGTGSIAFGRNAEGRTARAGGWGYAFGDEGSAFDLVRQALRAVLRFEEGWGSPTALRAALLDSTGAADADDLLHRFYSDGYPRARIASLAKIVDEVAAAGDAVAREILHAAAQSLAMLASAVRERLFNAHEGVRLVNAHEGVRLVGARVDVRVSYVGGVFRSAILLERMRALLELEEGNRVAAPERSPAAGALIEAYRLAGMDCRLTQIPEKN
jgi:N-acetylglucosamine kinase-like BadF-type ATPase